MKKEKQSRSIRMFHQVRELMESNLEKWQSIPEIVKTYDSFVKHLKKLLDLKPDLEMDMKSLKEEWEEKRIILVSKTFPVGNILLVYGEDHSKKTHPAFGIDRDQMNAMKNKELIKTAGLIYQKAVKYHESGLESYGLTDSMLTELDEAFRQSQYAFKMRSDMLSIRKKTLRESGMHFKAIRDLLDSRMDKLMSVFSGTHPSFYNAYVQIRKNRAL